MAEPLPRDQVSLPRVHEHPAELNQEKAKASTRVCIGLPCALKRNLYPAVSRETDPADLVPVSCLGYCDHAPVVERQGRYFTGVPDHPVEFEEGQMAFVRAHSKGIAEYVQEGGYETIKTLIREADPPGMLSRIEKSALRGMGGAGFPVHLKWRAILASHSSDRTLLVNAHEGEPGTFKDRILMERTPHLLLEGALIAAFAIGARRIIIATKPEYSHAALRMEEAIKELAEFARVAGLTLPYLDIALRVVPGTYVTGEESALMEALEGHRSEPRVRPPFPTDFGLEGKPTLVQNVETLTLLPGVFSRGGKFPLRKVFCLTGDVQNPGAYAGTLGQTASTLLEMQGATQTSSLKAILLGGLSGGILPAAHTDVALDFEPLKRKGNGLGTGAVIAIGKDRCMVEVLDNLTRFFAAESCGKCMETVSELVEADSPLRDTLRECIRGGGCGIPTVWSGGPLAQLCPRY